ncbi:MAG: heavy metal translocating P-type ATPase [Lachnospiraceae bacterium]|nr:heavy metal translocating P-type ATPase [Lachnospiraceae bacterium]
MNKKQKKMLVRIIIAAILMIVLRIAYAFLGEDETQTREAVVHEPFWFLLYMIPYLVIGYDILKKAGKGIINRQMFDENFLMAVATVGAIVVALVEQNGDYTEAIAVMLFYQIGELFQSYAVGKSRRNISALMDIRPDYANVEQDGELEQVDPDEVETGTIIVVQPGEKIPIDGIVTEGRSTLNTSALTGESLPREVQQGDEVISGCINMTSVIRVKTTKEFGESTVSKILDLVENSSSRKSQSENFISKFAKVYTPAVCIGALALALLPPVVMLLIGKAPMWSTWIYRALTFLVISCPCALVISIPLTFFAGIGGAGHAGILVKGSNYLEQLAKTKVVAMDKTGTMTKGVFEVGGIHHSSIDNEKLLEYAAHAECYSTHPIGKSIQKAYLSGMLWKVDEETGEARPVPNPAEKENSTKREIDRSRVGSVEEIGGNGILAQVDGKEIAIGNRKLMERQGIEFSKCHHVGTVVHVAIDGVYSGHIVISDVLKPTAKAAIAAMRVAGVSKTVILTGDAANVAEDVAKELGVDEVHSELLPADKVTAVEKLLDEKNKKNEKDVLIRCHDSNSSSFRRFPCMGQRNSCHATIVLHPR